MITFLAIDGCVFITVLLLIELQVWEKIKYFFSTSALQNSLGSGSSMDSKNAKMIPVEDNDVARERELIHSKPLAVLQLDNNLVIK